MKAPSLGLHPTLITSPKLKLQTHSHCGAELKHMNSGRLPFSPQKLVIDISYHVMDEETET